jgi:hypothetical protein
MKVTPFSVSALLTTIDSTAQRWVPASPTDVVPAERPDDPSQQFERLSDRR